MSVLIKGMEMPKDCTECPLYKDKKSYCGMAQTAVDLIEEYGQRNADCPLVEIPKHGRLIDADVLQNNFEWLEKVTNESNALDKAKYEQLTECIRMVKKMPIVIDGDIE